MNHLLVPGTKYEDYIRARVYSGRQPDLVGREEEWIKDRIHSMKTGLSDYEFCVKDKWYRVIRKQLDNGDHVNFQVNITAEQNREFELAESEELYRTLFEFCPDAVFIHDTKTITFANPACVELFRAKSVEDLIGRPAFDHTPPEFKEIVDGRANDILNSGKTAGRNEQEYLRLDGSRVEIESQGTRIVFEGKPAVLIIARDISARKENQRKLMEAHDNLEIMVEARTRDLTQEIEERRYTEIALKQSEARFRDIAEAASEWIWEMDADLRYTYMSERARETYGWDAGMPIGRSRLELVDQGEWIIDRAALEDHEDLMHRQEAFHNVEFSVITKDGRKIFTQINGKPIIDENGEFSGYRGTATNITDKKVTEIALKESEEIARVLLNSPTDPAILLDVDGIVLDANEAVLKRYDVSRDKIIGENIFNIMMIRDASDLDSIESRRDTLRQVVRERTPKSVVDKVGDRWFESNLYPILDEGGSVTRLAIYTKDITQQKQIELALRKAKDDADLANRSKSEFLANMSHELRSPLTAILGFSEAMQQEIFGPFENPKYKEYLENIHKSGSHLHQLINDILDVSAIEAGRLDLATQEIVVADLVMSSIRMVNPRAEQVGLEIEQNVPSDLPNIKGDERRLKQVLVNLLANAVKFTPEKGNIEVSACLTEDGLLLQVSDNGIGMDDKGIEEAITKFGQVESDLSRRYDGTGLGLPLSIGLIEIHGGKLTIDSEIGVGTTISVKLPNSGIIQN